MRVLFCGREMRASDFDARVTGLNGLLKKGQITPNEGIHIRWIAWITIYLHEFVVVHTLLLN